MAKKNIDKEEKVDRKAEREKRRLSDVKSEASSYGIDLDSPTPLTPDIKKNIAEGIKQAGYDDLTKEIEGFSKAYGDINIKQPSPIDKKKLLENRKKEKREKIFDVLRAVGAGFQGKDVESALVAPRLQKEREAEYQKYKDAVSGSKKQTELARDKYRVELIDFLEDQLSTKGDSELDKLQAEKIRAQIDKLKAETAWKKKQPYYKPTSEDGFKLGEGEHSLKGSNPFSTILKSISQDEDIFHSLPKDASELDKQRIKEGQAKDVLLQMYDIKYDDKGNRYLSPKSDADPKILDRTRTESVIKTKTAPIQKDIDFKTEQLNLEKQRLKDAGAIEWYDKGTYRDNISRIQGEINELEAQKREISNKYSAPKPSPKKTTSKKKKASSNQEVLENLGL